VTSEWLAASWDEKQDRAKERAREREEQERVEVYMKEEKARKEREEKERAEREGGVGEEGGRKIRRRMSKSLLSEREEAEQMIARERAGKLTDREREWGLEEDGGEGAPHSRSEQVSEVEIAQERYVRGCVTLLRLYNVYVNTYVTYTMHHAPCTIQ
jgi:hypothetical protein